MSKRDDAIEKITRILDSDSDYTVDLTQRLVRIPSVNPKAFKDPDFNRESAVQDVIEAELQALNMTIDRWETDPGRPNIVGNIAGTEERSLLLCGHVDVVPVGTASEWTVDPFGGEISNGRLYGRGAVDMKSGLAVAIGAIRAIRSAGIELEGRLALHSVVDEEAGGSGAKDTIKRGHLAKAGIITEPSGGDVAICSLGIEWLRITVKGQTGHATQRFNEIWPQRDTPDRLRPAVNAVHLAARFLEALERFESSRCRYRQHPMLPPGVNTINIGAIHGGMGLGENGLPVFMASPGVTPDVAVMDFSYRYLPNQNRDDVRAEFEAFVHSFCQQDLWMQENPFKVEWELQGLSFPALNTSPDHPLVESLLKRREKFGNKVIAFPAVCDASHYAQAGVECVVFGPTGANFHAEDEWVDIESIRQTTKDLAAAIIDWCGVK